MRRSTHFLEGSPGFSLRVTKRDDGKFEAFAQSHPELKFEGDDEIDATRNATRELQDRVMRGEL